MAKFELKSKNDLDAFTPLADGAYKASWNYNVKGDDGLLKQTSSVFDLAVSEKGTKYKATATGMASFEGDFAKFKSQLGEAFAEGHLDPMVAIDPAPPAASTATATATTDGPPWLLIAGAAVLAYVLLRKK